MGMSYGVELETVFSQPSAAQVGPQSLVVQTYRAVEQRESPKGRASLLGSTGPRSPPLPWIVLALEQSQGGHLIPACGGGGKLAKPPAL